MPLSVVEFDSYARSVPEALEAIGAGRLLAAQETVLLKPNLVGPSPHPVTTHPDHAAAVIGYVRDCSKARIVIGEGTGEASRETPEIFTALGYDGLAARYGVELVDLNRAELRLVEREDLEVFPEMHLPALALDSFIVSLPVLKAHSLAQVTGTLKNMMGLAPPDYYSGSGGWKKSKFHRKMQESLMDLARCVQPGLTVLDASVGLSDYHLGGSRCDPPVNKMVAGDDPYEVDRTAAELLGRDWRSIPHIARRVQR